MAALSLTALNTGTNRTLKKMHYAITTDAEDITTAATGDAVLIADASDEYKLKWGDGANLLEMMGSISAGITIGVDGTGYDVLFYGDTTGRYMKWIQSSDTLNVRGPLTVGVDDTGHDVQLFGATANMQMLWDESADSLLIRTAATTGFAIGSQAAAANPAFVVDASTGSQAAGFKITGATSGGTVATAVISSGADASLTVNAKGTGTIGIGSVSTGAVTITPATTVTGVITPTGGVAAAGGFTLKPVGFHTGDVSAQVSGDGTDVTPSVSEMYYAAIQIWGNCTITGVSVFLGSATEGNMKVGLFNSSGVNLKTSASTDISGATVDAYFRIGFTGGTYAAVGPATYYVGIIQDNTGNRFNAHTFGDFPTGKTTGETYSTGFTTFTPATTFTTAQGPIASLY